VIRAEELQDVDEEIDVSKKETVEFDLSIEEQALLHAVDADIEDAAAYCPAGKMFEVKIAREVSVAVIGTLKRAWEAGGWVVGVFEIVDSSYPNQSVRDREGPPDEHVFRVVFARPHKQPLPSLPATKNIVESLAAREPSEEFVPPDDATIARITSGRQVQTTTPLLIRMPTRARPAQALEVLKRYRDMALSSIAIEVVMDEDDGLCNNTQFLQRLAELDCTITLGRHKNKIEACNGGRRDDWGILMLASDDMWPVTRGYDQRILAAFEKHFPMLDGAINFNDGYNKDHVREGEPITNTLPIYGRYLYEDHGRYVYYPEYRSIYCDTDASFLFGKMNRMVFVDEIIVEHRHPANDKARYDELYQHNARHDDHDRLLFEERRTRGFDAPQLMLSILICSIPSRRAQLNRLVDYLRWQIVQTIGNPPPIIEICVDTDPTMKVGAKRQRLLERAVGSYVVFIDDDDWVSHDYVRRQLAACCEGKDCCSLVGVITENGEHPARFEHSLKYQEWRTSESGLYERNPNHLNAVKRSLALQAPFVHQNVGEDHDWSRRLLPLLQSEASTGSAPLYYYWNIPSKSVQSGGAR